MHWCRGATRDDSTADAPSPRMDRKPIPRPGPVQLEGTGVEISGLDRPLARSSDTEETRSMSASLWNGPVAWTRSWSGCARRVGPPVFTAHQAPPGQPRAGRRRIEKPKHTPTWRRGPVPSGQAAGRWHFPRLPCAGNMDAARPASGVRHKSACLQHFRYAR
jgi:hypothetical protein